MSVTIIIPARFASARLPGKPLADLGGKPMIQRVYEQVKQADVDRIIVAPDDERIADVVSALGAEVCMTALSHHSGTDRIAEVIEKKQLPDDEIIINLQCDEPFVPIENIVQLIDVLQTKQEVNMATLCELITDEATAFNPHMVKVVFDKNNHALYFSRASIPWHRDTFVDGRVKTPEAMFLYLHVGIYAYRAGFVKRYVQWPVAPLEKLEALEQLRVLWNDERIYVEEAKMPAGMGINTSDDLEKARRLIAGA
jgi:3-deoxy-manno-octulosonate cytidylyltransferase (CMP-KDO synthetase)